jgi:hypothetical protein
MRYGAGMTRRERVENSSGRSGKPTDALQALRDEFRHQLEIFYARLKLAPPYHSVEKAITHLTASLKTMDPAECDRLASDPALRWARFKSAFVESGLNQKHRGIIAGLAKSPLVADLPPEHQHFLDTFTSAPT